MKIATLDKKCKRPWNVIKTLIATFSTLVIVTSITLFGVYFDQITAYFNGNGFISATFLSSLIINGIAFFNVSFGLIVKAISLKNEKKKAKMQDVYYKKLVEFVKIVNDSSITDNTKIKKLKEEDVLW